MATAFGVFGNEGSGFEESAGIRNEEEGLQSANEEKKSAVVFIMETDEHKDEVQLLGHLDRSLENEALSSGHLDRPLEIEGPLESKKTSFSIAKST